MNNFHDELMNSICVHECIYQISMKIPGRHVCSVFVCRCVTRAAGVCLSNSSGMQEPWPTFSSGSKSWLSWAISSLGRLWTSFLHSSHTDRLAMNIPMSGRKTRIPLPASAPITLQTQTAHQHTVTEAYASFFHIHFSLNRSADVQLFTWTCYRWLWL